MSPKFKTILLYVLTGLTVLTVGLYFYTNAIKDKRIAQLEQDNNRLKPLERIDQNTVKKEGTESFNIKELVSELAPVIARELSKNGQDPTILTRVITQLRIDTVKKTADTVYKDNSGISWGSSLVADKWYSFKADWSCNPYQFQVTNFRSSDEIILVDYETDEGQGVYIRNKNPYNKIDSVGHFFKKQKQQTGFHLGAGLTGNLGAGNITPYIRAGLGSWSGSIGLNVLDTSGFIKPNVRSVTLGLEYNFIK